MKIFTIPNLVCYLRVVFCFFSIYFFQVNQNQNVFLILVLIVMLMDALDGYLARKLNQCSVFGAKLDVYSDRIVELSYWLYFALIHRIGFWVFVVFLLRGLIVDYITMQTETPLGDSWLRSSRFMRFMMGLAKILSFIFLILYPSSYITFIVVCLAVLTNLLRGLPVIYDLLKRSYNK